MKYHYQLLWLFIILVLIAGLCFPLLQGSDANEYASIATQMFYRNDWVNIINHDPITGGQYDYLDKPHLLFWSSMIGYKLFGVGAFGYRFISVLMSLAGAFGVYRLGRLLYNNATGKMAAVFFITAQAIILANHDVKTDTLLTAFVALAVWQFAEFCERRNLLNMIWGAAFLAGGVGTKGMIAVLVTGCVIFFYILGKQNWKVLFTWKWFVGIAAFFIFLSPILFCYWLQFDLHPEKLVNGGYGRSGIQFLLWSQSMDRFAGQRSLYPEFSFFFHTFLWAFLPWCLLAYYGSFYRVRELIQSGGASFFSREQLTFTGTWVMFILMSLSKFKLPHYLNVLFPMFAVFTAGFIMQLYAGKKEKLLGNLVKVQWGFLFICITAMLLINYLCFPVHQWWILTGSIAGIIYIFFLLRRKEDLVTSVWYPSAIAILILNFLLNANFYPAIGKYQPGSAIAIAMKNNGISPEKVYNYISLDRPFDFYSMHWQPILTNEQITSKLQAGEEVIVYADDDKKPILEQTFRTRIIMQTPNYNIAGLTIKFLNPQTRKDSYTNAYLLKIIPN